MKTESTNHASNVQRLSVTVNGTELSYLQAGSGKPLVFVHGSVTTSELFRDAVAHYSAHYRTIAVDLRGYGNSAKPGHGYTMEQFSSDIAALMEALQLPRAVLLGVSMGGFVAQRVALDRPDLLAGLVLASTSDGELAPGLLDEDPARAFKQLGWRQISSNMITGAFPPGTDPRIVEALLARIDTWNEQVIAGAIDSIRTFSTRTDLPRISVPTLVMVGTEDHQLPVRFSERMHRAIKGSKLAVFQGAGHFMMVEQPAEFRRVLDGFLKSIAFYGEIRKMETSNGNETTGLRVRQLATLFERSDVKITHTILDPGQEIPWHLHHKVADVFYVIKGPLTIMTKELEAKVSLNPGDTYRAAILQPHRVVNEGSETVEFFLIQGIGAYDFKLA